MKNIRLWSIVLDFVVELLAIARPKKAFVLILFFSLLTASITAQSVGCDTHLSVWKFMDGGMTYTRINNVTVTGPTYPVDFIRNNLTLTDELIETIKTKNLSVLLVAEGYSGLLPFLVKAGVKNIKALDPLYGVQLSPRSSQFLGQMTFIMENKSYLIAGDARSITEEAGHPDLYISHLLVNNIINRDILRIVDEAIRVVNKGGRILIYGFDNEASDMSPSGDQEMLEGSIPEGEVDIPGSPIDLTTQLLKNHSSGRVKSFKFTRIKQKLRGREMRYYLLDIRLYQRIPRAKAQKT